jgi:hypothetical protein
MIDIDKFRPEIISDAEWVAEGINAGLMLQVDNEVSTWSTDWTNAVFSFIAQHDDGSYFVSSSPTPYPHALHNWR